MLARLADAGTIVEQALGDPAFHQELVVAVGKPVRFVTDPLEQMDGFSHAYFLVDRASGKGMSITIWESEQALSASVARADELRKQGTETGGASIESVEHYEIGLTVGSP